MKKRILFSAARYDHIASGDRLRRISARLIVALRARGVEAEILHDNDDSDGARLWSRLSGAPVIQVAALSERFLKHAGRMAMLRRVQEAWGPEAVFPLLWDDLGAEDAAALLARDPADLRALARGLTDPKALDAAADALAARIAEQGERAQTVEKPAPAPPPAPKPAPAQPQKPPASAPLLFEIRAPKPQPAPATATPERRMIRTADWSLPLPERSAPYQSKAQAKATPLYPLPPPRPTPPDAGLSTGKIWMQLGGAFLLFFAYMMLVPGLFGLPTATTPQRYVPEPRFTPPPKAAPVQAAAPKRVSPPPPELKPVFRDCPNCPPMQPLPPERAGGGLALAMGVTEVTFDQWQACLDDGYCGRYEPSDNGWGRTERPVIFVSYNDAQRYVDWLNIKLGKTRYRLPTREEWVYAARAGTSTKRYWDDLPLGYNQCVYANANDATSAFANQLHSAAKCDDGYANTAYVGRFKPNAYRLYDMLGNVWEWTSTCRVAKPGVDCETYMTMGGSWSVSPIRLTADSYGLTSATRRDAMTGFRVVKDLTVQ